MEIGAGQGLDGQAEQLSRALAGFLERQGHRYADKAPDRAAGIAVAP
jgi:hypothetical protein